MKCLKYLYYGVLIAVPTITWAQFFKEWYEQEKQYKQHLLFLKRHNCVVMYTTGKMTGWPSQNTTNQNENRLNVKELYEPILYFIRTAKTSIDIAVMTISVECIIDELLEAVKRNVKVRIITDFHFNRNYKLLIPLQRVGVEVLYYIAPQDDPGSIFHYKYIVKDYSITPEEGYLCVGSLNFSVSAVTTSYEDVNFISHHGLVTQYRNNFEESWSMISSINNSSSYVKEKFKEMDFYL
ncbi:hypothetical protein RI129_011822 [Pyrocoelia pectoralis]|uniref:Mitochondrial cardiolipin hydrolase n=1 Tax=Pyrocoelia pectoralis TaxID=417401 RepID=A0AAN7UXF4_9COLE